jgi:tripartite-type tricarboxylate transporter receptor subunit TctC
MNISRRRLVVATGLLAGSAAAWSQSYPSQPIRLIVPYAPGGGTDISARVIAKQVSDALGQPVLVDNRPGAGTTLGTAIVAKAPPDGYTLVYGSVTHTIAPALYKARLPYNALRDFTPVAEIATFPFVLVTRPDTGIRSVKELIARAKAQPGKLNYGSVGNGTGTHLAGEMFKQLTGTEIVHVPYNGSGPALVALLGKQVDLAILDTPPVMQHLGSGTLKVLAVTTARRASVLPDVPTLAEAGAPGFDFTSWWGVMGPAGLPEPVVQRLNTEFAKALRNPEVQKSLASFAADPVINTPQEFGRTIRAELDKYERVVTTAHIQIE